MAVDFRRLGPSVLTPSRTDSRRHAGAHFVQLYDDDSALVEAVRTFLLVGLAAGDAALVVADSAHRDMFEQALGSAGVDVESARAQGRYISLDADETLARFMIDGEPDPSIFAEVLGALVERAAESGTRVRVFGEMVARLWGEGNVTGAVRLEELWNALAETHSFQLFCAYPIEGFEPESLPPLRQICHQHTHVIPPGR